jgi:hypothetical protein
MTVEETAWCLHPRVYALKGTLPEACLRGVLWTCWIKEDPDHGTCESFST